jgi:hypothetical protein
MTFHGQEWWLMPVIPETQEEEIRRIGVQGQPRQKARPPSQINKLSMVVHTCSISYREV